MEPHRHIENIEIYIENPMWAVPMCIIVSMWLKMSYTPSEYELAPGGPACAVCVSAVKAR